MKIRRKSAGSQWFPPVASWSAGVGLRSLIALVESQRGFKHSNARKLFITCFCLLFSAFYLSLYVITDELDRSPPSVSVRKISNSVYFEKFCRDSAKLEFSSISIMDSVSYRLVVRRAVEHLKNLPKSSIKIQRRIETSYPPGDTLTNNHADILDSIEDPALQLSYNARLTRRFASLFLAIADFWDDLESLLNEDLIQGVKISDQMIWREILCDGDSSKEVTELFREYVLLENKLFPWLTTLNDPDAVNQYPIDQDECFSFLKDSNKTCAILYRSPIWTLWRRFTSHLHYIGTSENSKGLVICGGNKHLSYIMGLIWNIRRTYGSSLQIEVFYLGEEDLSSRNKLILESFPSVFCRNIYEYFDQEILNLHGWDIKPFAILASNATEVALIDGDVGFVQSPDLLFEQASYSRTGALFFHDRTWNGTGYDSIAVLNLVTLYPSEQAKNLRSFRRYTEHEMESGVVVINKARRFVGILGVCRIMSADSRSILYQKVHGDKESYWLGFEMMGEPYSFSQWFPGSIGFVGKNQSSNETSLTKTCGRMLHFDDSGNPFWWNGGFKNSEKHHKNYSRMPWLEMESFDDGGKLSESVETLPSWSANPDNTNYCSTASPRGNRKLSDKERNKALQAVEAFAILDKDFREEK